VAAAAGDVNGNYQADYLSGFRQARQVRVVSREAIYGLFGQPDPSFDRVLHDDGTNIAEAVAKPSTDDHTVDPRADLTHCILRLANLPNFALDRLNRYEATLRRQAMQIVYALDTLDRRKPQERLRRRYGFEEAKE
jgi:hypothetical protein